VIRPFVPASFLVSFALPLGQGAAQTAHPPVAAPVERGNVLLIVADDLGCDMLAGFGQHPAAPPTPNLDALAAEGVSFVNAYTDPICSPTRAALLTGRYGFRTGMGSPVQTNLPEFTLPRSEVTLPERLALSPGARIAASAVGKWHLSSALETPKGPNLHGFPSFSGTEGNLYFGQTFYSYLKIVDGHYVPGRKYATSEQVDDAIERLDAMPEPWFLYLAFNAPHQPFHKPPAHLHGYALSGPPTATPQWHYRAAVEAMDSEIGRLLDALPEESRERTTVIFIGDNGSPEEAILPPVVPGMNKGTLYEGGVHVPLIVSGRGVRHPGSICSALVNSVDVYPTMLELFDLPASGAPQPEIDGHSLVPYLERPLRPSLRDWVFASRFSPNGLGPFAAVGTMIRTQRWKLIYRLGQGDLFFDMANPSPETHDLLVGPLTPEQDQAYRYLRRELSDLLGS
jgi:arylsulfatase A-like enzyme